MVRSWPNSTNNEFEATLRQRLFLVHSQASPTLRAALAETVTRHAMPSKDTLAHLLPGEAGFRIGLEIGQPAIEVGFQLAWYRDGLRDRRNAVPDDLN